MSRKLRPILRVAPRLPRRPRRGRARPLPPAPQRERSGSAVPQAPAAVLHAPRHDQAAWKPSGTETDFTLSRLLAPLERHKSKICVLSGVNMQDVGVGAPHTKGVPLIWTGGKLLDDGTFVREDGSGGPTYGWNSSAVGRSGDRRDARRRRPPTARSSSACAAAASFPSNRMIYTAARQPLQPATDPWSQFDRLFAGRSDAVADERLRGDADRARGARAHRAADRRGGARQDRRAPDLARQPAATACRPGRPCAPGPSLPDRVNAGDIAHDSERSWTRTSS